MIHSWSFLLLCSVRAWPSLAIKIVFPDLKKDWTSYIPQSRHSHLHVRSEQATGDGFGRFGTSGTKRWSQRRAFELPQQRQKHWAAIYFLVRLRGHSVGVLLQQLSRVLVTPLVLCPLSWEFGSCTKIIGNGIVTATNAVSHTFLGPCVHSTILAICGSELGIPLLIRMCLISHTSANFIFEQRAWTQFTCSPKNVHHQVIGGPT